SEPPREQLAVVGEELPAQESRVKSRYLRAETSHAWPGRQDRGGPPGQGSGLFPAASGGDTTGRPDGVDRTPGAAWGRFGASHLRLPVSSETRAGPDRSTPSRLSRLATAKEGAPRKVSTRPRSWCGDGAEHPARLRYG